MHALSQKKYLDLCAKVLTAMISGSGLLSYVFPFVFSLFSKCSELNLDTLIKDQ